MDSASPVLSTSTADLNRFIAEEGVDLVCASVNWDYNADKAIEVLRTLPAGITLVVGGQTATTYAEEMFEKLPGMTALVRGEGEETIREFALGQPFETILGLSYRKNGGVAHNANRPLPPAGILPSRFGSSASARRQ